MHSVQFNANPTYIANLSIAVFNDTEGVSRVNFTLMQIVDFVKVYVSISLLGASDEKSNDYNQQILKGNIDTCSVSKGTMGNFIIKMIADSIKKYSNYRFACPQVKGFYHAHNFNVSADEHVPYYLIGRGGKFKFSATVKAKIANVKSAANIMSVEFYGEKIY